jgi:hypothetical protein
MRIVIGRLTANRGSIIQPVRAGPYDLQEMLNPNWSEFDNGCR